MKKDTRTFLAAVLGIPLFLGTATGIHAMNSVNGATFERAPEVSDESPVEEATEAYADEPEEEVAPAKQVAPPTPRPVAVAPTPTPVPTPAPAPVVTATTTPKPAPAPKPKPSPSRRTHAS